ncbi:ENOS interacting protein [Hypoxylon fragiforme]|uniref:ENOS interacting protein n=1 Tax=Hypoxylon fragiforme TaxID=63214 RepID=UPI0020C64C96|nr:ENOS interacting protein [Hypoxylon fragiforme]KAI2612483.1 ENOS interacting protein [Hypoxylon fragiforme]
MSHSKRNTSRAVFTSHERDLARRAWSSTSARLSRESYLPFSSCGLCLEIAQDPVSCVHGDVFCRECALSNILAQKKEIKRLDRLREQESREADEERTRLEAEERERAVREFEMTQIGLDAKPRNNNTTNNNAAAGGRLTESRDTPVAAAAAVEEAVNGARKRKFEMDEEELARIAKDDRAKARKALDDEKAAKPTLPSFWTPSVTPSSNTKDVLHEVAKKTKSTPICPASKEDKPHAYSLHTLVTVNFTEEEAGDDAGKGRSTNGKKERIRVCPSCKKGLNNASKAMLAKPCGHVLCRSCIDKFMRPSRQQHHHDPHASAGEAERVRCYVCEADLTEKSGGGDGGQKGKKKEKDKEKMQPGLVELRSEGTGFSAGGANQVQKSGISFQC